MLAICRAQSSAFAVRVSCSLSAAHARGPSQRVGAIEEGARVRSACSRPGRQRGAPPPGSSRRFDDGGSARCVTARERWSVVIGSLQRSVRRPIATLVAPTNATLSTPNERLMESGAHDVAECRATTAPPPPCEIDVLDPASTTTRGRPTGGCATTPRSTGTPSNELWVISQHEDVSHVSRHHGALLGRRRASDRRAAPDVDHLDGRSGAHPPAPLINRGLHAGQGPGAHRPHPRAVQPDHRRGRATAASSTSSRTSPSTCRSSSSPSSWASTPSSGTGSTSWSDAMMAGDSATTHPTTRSCSAAAEAFGEYATMCIELIEERRADPVRRGPHQHPHPRLRRGRARPRRPRRRRRASIDAERRTSPTTS